MKTDIPLDPEGAVIRLQTLCDLAKEINTDARTETWKNVNDRVWVLLEAMEPLMDGLYQYFSGGASNDHT